MESQHSDSTSTTSPVHFTFAQDGIGPPLYLAGSFSEPAWQLQEMKHEKRAQADAHEHDEYDFFLDIDVPEGEWQYKFRVGNGDWWMLDDQAQTVTDPSGIKNSLLLVPPKAREGTSNHLSAPSAETDDDDKIGTLADPAIETPQQLLDALKEKLDHGSDKAKPAETDQQSSRPAAIEPLPQITEEVPIPFTVVEKAPDLEAPAYGDLSEERAPFEEDGEKRMADAEPDQVVESSSSSDEDVSTAVSEAGDFQQVECPTVTVEKSDSRPSFGDDFGPSATVAQKLEHKRRESDAQPDKVVLSVEPSFVPPSPSDHSVELDGGKSISESANVAAEVADTAAALDPELAPPLINEDHSAFALACGYAANRESPRMEYGPLFAHESFEAPSQAMHRPRKPSQLHLESRRSSDESESTLEEFPLDLASICQRIKTTEEQLEEDKTYDVGHIESPVLAKMEPLVAVRTRSISPLNDRSPSMNSIPEEDDTPLSSNEDLQLPESERKNSTGDMEIKASSITHHDGEIRSHLKESDERQATTATGLLDPIAIVIDDEDAGQSSVSLDKIAPPPPHEASGPSPTTHDQLNLPSALVERREPSAKETASVIPSISAHRGEHQNYLQAFWQTVFAGWFAALFAAIFGRRSVSSTM
ncbi:MAG: hypothetical protein M1817_001256 [Caeruleum heppii]|nr:MAG: hypothetical protein M1817_001256 [Caeruleum heppii]